MTIVYHEQDGNLQALAGKTISVIGYGAIGRLAALSLRDTGVQVIIGGDANDQANATADDIAAESIAGAVQASQIVLLMLPDEIMPGLYMSHISPYLTRQHTLIFSSAYNVASRFIEPPPFVDVGLIAPRTVGAKIRPRFAAENAPYYSFVAVASDASRHAWDTVLAVALALGALRGGAIEINFEQESELNLFIQQAILPAVHHVMMTAAELLLQNGYPPEAAFTDLYLSGKFTEHLQEAAKTGLMETLDNTTLTAQYGTYSRLERFNDLKMERLMEKVLEEIRGGDFAQEWSKEFADGSPRLNKLKKFYSGKDLWDLEQQTLEMMGDPPNFEDFPLDDE